ncbi:extensin-like [Arvicola amphibius]|uniref:extensin-like n=1 Tax=Arvicola amphibius TaxID=1047088 RepID=UPI001C086257|nr:extensin-like [Arvicola amphibius]
MVHKFSSSSMQATRAASPGPPGLPLLPSNCSINSPEGPQGPRRVPPPIPPRSKLRAPQKPPLSPTTRDISPGPPRSITLPLPPCMPTEQPHQVKTEKYITKVEDTKPEGLLHANYDNGDVSQPTANTELPSCPGTSDRGPPGLLLLPANCSINGPERPQGPRCVPPPIPPRSKLWAPQKPPLSPTTRDISPGPPRSITLPLPPCMPTEQPHQVEDTKPKELLPANYDDGNVSQPTANTELPSCPGTSERGPPGLLLLPANCSINGPERPQGPRCVPPPIPPRSKLWAPQKPPLSPTTRDISPGPPRSITLPLPPCMPTEQPHQVEDTKLEGFLPASYDDCVVTHPTANTQLSSYAGTSDRDDTLQGS